MTDTTTFDGVAQFPSRTDSSYRYKLTTSGDSMSVWLEDRESKHQWASSDLTLSDVVDKKNVISQATMADYVSCFQNCLESTCSKLKRSASNTIEDKTPKDKTSSKSENDADSSCDLVPLDKETWSLRFEVALKAFATVWRSTYAISLKPVELQPIDILTAQLRDVQDELKQLQGKHASPPYVLLLQSTERITQNQTIKWSVVDVVSNGEDAPKLMKVDAAGGKVVFLESGVYLVNLALNHSHCSNSYGSKGVNNNNIYNLHCELQRDGVGIQTCSLGNGGSAILPFGFVVAIRKGQSLTVVNKSLSYVDATSTMTVTPFK